MDLSLSLFLIQWAIAGTLLIWVTSRRRIVNPGYSIISKAVFAAIALIGALAAPNGSVEDPSWLGPLGFISVAAISFTLAASWVRRSAGVAEQEKLAEERSKRVAHMTGIETEHREKASGAEFDPRIDLYLMAPLFVALVALTWIDSGLLAAGRIGFGMLLVGALTDAMALGHWYLVQPGLPRAPLVELVRLSGLVLLPTTALLMIPESLSGASSMLDVFTGVIDDGYNGLLGWFWAASVAATVLFLVMTELALRERQYSAVMAATGLLYLAILTGFSVDLLGRALL